VNEEIDIIELLKRVKEGKAPKKIEINGEKYYYNEKWNDVFYAYLGRDDKKIFQNFVSFDTKIKILDKPIIDELSKVLPFDDDRALIIENRDKINEIARHINKEEK